VSFSETWPKATADGSENNDPPPEGSYEVALVDTSAFVSKKGAEIVKLELRVVSAHENGHEWTELRSFASQGAANAAKAACSRLGVDVESVSSLEELDAELKQLVGRYYEVSVVRNGEYLNTYVEHETTAQHAAPAAAAEAAAPAAGAADSDPVPW
jgi:hypothetical protein